MPAECYPISSVPGTTALFAAFCDGAPAVRPWVSGHALRDGLGIAVAGASTRASRTARRCAPRPGATVGSVSGRARQHRAAARRRRRGRDGAAGRALRRSTAHAAQGRHGHPQSNGRHRCHGTTPCSGLLAGVRRPRPRRSGPGRIAEQDGRRDASAGPVCRPSRARRLASSGRGRDAGRHARPRLRPVRLGAAGRDPALLLRARRNAGFRLCAADRGPLRRAGSRGARRRIAPLPCAGSLHTARCH